MEVCVDQVSSIINAVNGGASRIELCSALSEGGLTPSLGFLKFAKAFSSVPVFAMIRPRGGDLAYSQEEVEIMKEDVVSLKEAGADGFVFGILDEERNVDKCKCSYLMEAAGGLPVTFHRAFDIARDPLVALEEIICLGFRRILTSGQKETALEGANFIKELGEAAKGRILLMPGSGVSSSTVMDILKITNAREIHGSAKTTPAYVTDEHELKRIVSIFIDFHKFHSF